MQGCIEKDSVLPDSTADVEVPAEGPMPEAPLGDGFPGEAEAHMFETLL